jgi:GT2 family glycosyltransferase
MLADRLSVVVLSYNRSDELVRTLDKMIALNGDVEIIVVDNASRDGSVVAVRREFPQVTLIALEHNIGAAARNIGVERVKTPYVAFADDDSWWAEGSLERAVGILDAHPRTAAVCARVLLGTEEREDPICRIMEASPLPSQGLPGPALLGFIACAVVFRRHAYLDAGGYEQKFFVGGEEELLTLDLVARGWNVAYVRNLTVHHYPSPQRDNIGRQKIVIRNALWVTWLRFPVTSAWRETKRICRNAPSRDALGNGILSALRELPWVYRNRRILPVEVQRLHQSLRA